MKKSYWVLFVLAILCPFFVGISFLLKFKEIAFYEYFLYLSGAILALFIISAVKELILALKDLK
ncbi:MAG: hypothetical protein ACI8ZX_000638 [Planctomycetota bacterium]|jgi:hypothetical protein